MGIQGALRRSGEVLVGPGRHRVVPPRRPAPPHPAPWGQNRKGEGVGEKGGVREGRRRKGEAVVGEKGGEK